MVKTYPPIEIDGRNLYYMFLAGARKIIENQSHLNKINVFPVQDGDTGTNMASTVRSVIDNLRPERSYKLMADSIAETTLINARGNSGIIFAQFLYGMSNETDHLQEISLDHFIQSIKNSVKYIYSAVSNPVEGTMLTIIRKWAEYIETNKNKFKDFNQLFLKSKEVLETSLEETRHQLEVLSRADVVDAGAKAFFFFIQGMIDLILTRDIRQLIGSELEATNFHDLHEHIPEKVEYRYCTEGLLRNLDIDSHSLSKLLEKHGDSVVVAGASKTCRVHVHTNDPARLFEELQNYGTISLQKADDMVRQSEAVYNRKAKIALVTDSACDLSQELIDKHQIHLVPININFGENHYLDRVTIRSEQFYEKLRTSDEFPKTSQVNEQAFRNLYSHLASHYDAVIAVHLTGKFSGTYFNSVKAADKVSHEFKKKIAVADSRNVSGGLGLLSLRIAEAIEQGDSFEKIVSGIEKWTNDIRIFVSVRTLKYMVKGGRVSTFKGFVAKVLNINPIVSMDADGNSMVFDKAYSQKANMIKVMNHIKQISSGRKIWNYIVLHASNPEAATWYETEMKAFCSLNPVAKVNISPVIVANAGIGAASVAIMFQ